MKQLVTFIAVAILLGGCTSQDTTSLKTPSLKAGEAGLSTYSTAEPLPNITTKDFGTFKANETLPSNLEQILRGVATNLVLNKASTDNAALVNVIRIVEMQDYVWDPVAQILYKREVNNNRLYYIAVTNVDLRAQGVILMN